MGSEIPSNKTEKLEITSSAEKDLRDFEHFVRSSDIAKVPDNKLLLSNYIYKNFCISPEEGSDSLSKRTIKKYVDSMKSVEDELSNIRGIKLSENYTDWLGYEINGSYDKNKSLGRVYINTKTEYTPEIFGNLTKRLQEDGVHCEIKTSRGGENDSSRVESMVIYFNGTESGRLYNTLLNLYTDNSEKFDNEIPRFTRQLKDMPGISFGEEPVMPDESFNYVRAQILARVYYKYKRSNFDENFDFIREFQDACSSFQVDSKDPSKNQKYLEN